MMVFKYVKPPYTFHLRNKVYSVEVVITIPRDDDGDWVDRADRWKSAEMERRRKVERKGGVYTQPRSALCAYSESLPWMPRQPTLNICTVARESYL